MKKLKIILATFISIYFFISCNSGIKKQSDNLASESFISLFDSAFKNGILNVWYPRVIDSIDGGYLSNLSFDWKVAEFQPKMLVSQSRQVWTSSQAAMFYNDSSYNKYARHGVEFMINHMWDTQYGGFFNIRSKNGGYLDYSYKNEKRAYGNTFAIYGLVSCFNATKDTVALDYAKKTFLWLEKHSHDNVNGGYIDIMDQDGIWISEKGTKSKNPDALVAPWKDYNSSIHLLEAFTELYKVWPDALVKARLQEMLTLIRDTFITEKGFLKLYLTEDWKHVSNSDSSEQVIRKKSFIDHISFGHDVETAFLLLEASHALNIENDTVTLRVAKRLVDHSLAAGFDNRYGGFFYEGYYFKGSDTVTIINTEKSWWVQAEGLNALLLMSKIFPDNPKYYNAFLKQWKHIDKYIIDKQHGDWYISGLDYNPEAIKAPKASVWKANYHNGRALMNCIKILKGENEVANHFSKIKLRS